MSLYSSRGLCRICRTSPEVFVFLTASESSGMGQASQRVHRMRRRFTLSFIIARHHLPPSAWFFRPASRSASTPKADRAWIQLTQARQLEPASSITVAVALRARPESVQPEQERRGPSARELSLAPGSASSSWRSTGSCRRQLRYLSSSSWPRYPRQGPVEQTGSACPQPRPNRQVRVPVGPPL